METQSTQIHNFHSGDRFHEHYRLLEHVGSGGFADVWKAKDELVDTIVALKIYTRLDKEGISELAKEYKDMRGIKHPNLLTGNHFDASGNIPYLEMDYCDGGSMVRKVGKMTNDELLRMAHDIAKGLAYLHSEGIVHQDIKPENILYDTAHKRYLLSDFGISSKSRTRLSKSVNMANMTLSMTEAYAPPEKFSGNMSGIAPDTKGDIFSLGMTLFELAVGKLPFDPPMATGREMFYSQGRLQLDYSRISDPLLRGIVVGCTHFVKSERLSADDVLDILADRKAAPKPPNQEQTGTSGSVKPHTVKINYNQNNRYEPQPSKPEQIEKSRHDRPSTVKVNTPLGDNQVHESSKPKERVNKSNARKVKAEDCKVIDPDSVVDEGKISEVRIDGNTLRFIVDGQEYIYRMVRVNEGSFTMGCTSEQGEDCWEDEKPAHRVTVSSYYIGQTEVTQALWKAVMGSNPCRRKDYKLPVDSVSYEDCKLFIVRLNNMTGANFRLPTEAEWEYAARGGGSSRGYKYSGGDNIDSVAWYYGNSGNQTHPVAQKQANELGLYDMSGNMWEWCSDWYGAYSDDSLTNPKGPSLGFDRVCRGGSWNLSDRRCRVSSRGSNAPLFRLSYLGFRLAC